MVIMLNTEAKTILIAIICIYFNCLCYLFIHIQFYNLNDNLIPSVTIPVPIIASINPINLPISENEELEKLEQLRMLDNGISLYCLEINQELIGIDTQSDIQKAEKILKSKDSVKLY